MNRLSHRFLTSPLPLVLGALLALYLAWTLLRMVWLLLAGPALPVSASVALPSMPSATRSATLAHHSLFGEATAPTPSAQTPALDHLEGWRLQGVLLGGDRALAILADPTGEARVYRADQALDGERRLLEIEADTVVIVQRGRSHRLRVHEQEADASAPAPTLPATSHQAASHAELSIEGLGTASVAALLDHLPSAVSDHLVALPVRGGGLRVRPGRDGRVFAELGLQSNDVITAINGRPIGEQADVMAVLMQADSVSITLQRSGRELVLNPDRDALIRSLSSR